METVALIAFVASDSVPGLRYEVRLPTEPAERPRCQCPAYFFGSGGVDALGQKSCKHLRAAASRRVVWAAEHVVDRHCRECGAPAEEVA